MNDTTRRHPRTLRETERDQMDWWQSAEAAAAEEEHIRAMFNERQPASLLSRFVGWFWFVVGMLAAFLALIAVRMDWLPL